MFRIEYVKMDPRAKEPSSKYPNDAGRDFYSIEEKVIYPGTTATVRTGLQLQIEWDLPFDPKRETPSVVYSKGMAQEVFHWMNVYIMENFTPWFKIESRSGLSVKHGLKTGAGVIDWDYGGEIVIVLHNVSKKSYTVKEGERIAQGIFQLRPNFKFEEVDELSLTDRGSNGFGSTGSN